MQTHVSMCLTPYMSSFWIVSCHWFMFLKPNVSLQVVGRWSCFLCWVSTVQIYSIVYTLPMCVFLGLFWSDMDSDCRNVVPFAILFTDHIEAIYTPKAVQSKPSYGTRCSWIWRNTRWSKTKFQYILQGILCL